MTDAPPKVKFFSGDYRRDVADSGPIYARNRYFELNPHLSDDGESMLARPGLRYLTTVGQGPIRGIYTEEGSFNGDLFVASYDQLYRLNKALVNTLIFTGLNNPERGVVSMAVTAPIGQDVPEFLFFADGRNLFVYVENGFALGTITGAPANNDVVRIGNIYYQFTNAGVNVGAPAGTLANPWKVAWNASAGISWTNFQNAIDASGVAGTQYSTALTLNPDARMATYGSTSVTVTARLAGALGNGIITTETGAGIAWGGGTLTGGGAPMVRIVQLPEDLGAVDVVVLKSFVFVLPVQQAEFKGRVYYIQPGETTIDPLDYFTAERSPDGVNGLEVAGDLLWLPGDGSTEAWYVSQDASRRMQQLQGVVFDRGTWEGTAIAIHDGVILCGSDGSLQEIKGGSPKRLSTPGIEEEIRRAIARQLALTP